MNMQRSVEHRSAALAAGAACLMLVQCAPTDGPDPAVEYGPATLQYTAAASQGSAAGQALPMAPGSNPMAPGPTMGGGTAGTAAMGTAGTAAIAGGKAGASSVASGSGGMGVAGTGTTGGSAGAPPTTGSVGKLTFAYTTKAYGGRYTPRNAGAVWITDSSGKWIRTLEYWGSTPNDTHLTKYVATKAPDYALCGALEKLFGSCPGSNVTMPPPDVITAATFLSHKAHSGDSWDFKDAMGAPVPDGAYKIVIEIAEDDTSEKTQEVPFMKSEMPDTSMPADTATVIGMKLAVQ